MRTVNFPLCCGAKIITDFGGTNVSMGRHGAINPEEVEKYLREQLHTFRGYSFLVIILNQKQRALYNKTLRRVGFRCVVANVGNHGHKNYMYVAKPAGIRRSF